VRDIAKASSARSSFGRGALLGLFGRAFATRGASSDAQGSGAPSRRRTRPVASLAVALLGVVGLLALWAVSASAALVHPYVSSFGSFSDVQGVVVESSSGYVYVYDGGEGKVLKFDASGNPVNFTATGTNAISGVGFAGGDEGEIAADSSSGPAKGDIYVAHADGSVNIYSEAGAKLGELTEESPTPWGEACGVAVDSSGNVYVGLYGSHVNKYVPAANPVTNANFASSMGGLNSVCNVAADSAGNVFSDTWRSGPVTRYEPSQFGSLSASGSVVDSKGSTLAVDPANDEVYVDERNRISQFGAHGEPFQAPVMTFAGSGSGAISNSLGISVSGFNHDVYVSDGKGAISVFGPAVVVPDVTTGVATSVTSTSATLNGSVNTDGVQVTDCHFEYGTTISYDKTAPCAETVGSSGSVSVHADVSGLTLGETYHFRLVVASNANGSSAGGDLTFATPGPPLVSAESFSNVASTEATLSVGINPNYASTTYHVEYGTDASYGQSTPESEAIGSDHVDHTVVVHLSGLAPGVTYHFRFVATNVVETVNGADTTFTTYTTPTPPSSKCPNEQRREEQSSTYLPDCRAYEMVSPLDKNGSDVIGSGRVTGSSSNGNGVTYGAYAGFGETDGSGILGITQYVASRHEGEGWVSRGITPTPAKESLQLLAGVTTARAFSSDLSHAVVEGYDLPGGPGGIPYGENYYLESTTTGALEAITTPLGSETPEPFAVWSRLGGFSSDLGVVTFESSANLLPGTASSSQKLYAWEHGVLKLAGVLPDGTQPAGGSHAVRPPFFSALEDKETISSDGSRIVFVATPNGGSQPQLYMRKNGSATVWVSEPEMAGAPEPSEVTFEAMTPSGEKLLFASSSRLLASDPGGEGVGLYMYTDGPDPEGESNLAFIARIKPTNSFGSVVADAVTGMSENGERIYFYTKSTPGFSQSGTYLWDKGISHFVASTVSALEPRWSGGAEVSAGGRVLAFVSEERLDNAPTASGTWAMYVYDETGETLICASCLPTGAVATNSVEIAPKANKLSIGTVSLELNAHFLSGNGRYVFFSTPEPLVASDVNGQSDVYEYDTETGDLSLLSTGTSEGGAWFASADAEGNNVFILTRQPLTGWDTDTLVDLYDVRVNGGFPEPKPARIECVGDECQGTPSAAPSFNTASGFSGLGNVVPPATKGSAKAKTKELTRTQKLSRALKACKRKPKRKRRACMRDARRRFGAKGASSRPSRRAGRR